LNKDAKIYLAGHTGLVGGAVYRALQAKGYTNIITRTREELDLTRQQETEDFFAAERPEYVILAAAKVGGILANSTYTAEFIYRNSMIAANIIHSAYRSGVTKLLNLGSSCIYPKLAEQPLREEALLSDYLEPTNEPYAIAKIAAIKLCRYYNEQYGTNFISAMPTNLYGPGDNFDLQTSHVLPALLRKIHEAKAAGSATVTVWGDGSPLREFLYVEDLAQGLLFLLENVDAPELKPLSPDYFINIGTGVDVSIRDLAQTIARVVGWHGTFDWDTNKPNGTPRKLMDVSKLTRLGWRAETELEDGVANTYEWYTTHKAM